MIERDATAALIRLTNVPCCPSFHDGDGSNNEFLDEDPSVHSNDPVSMLVIVKVPVFDKEQFFGISVSATCTDLSSDAPDVTTDINSSDNSQEYQSDIIPSSNNAILGKKEYLREIQSQRSGISSKHISIQRFRTWYSIFCANRISATSLL